MHIHIHVYAHTHMHTHTHTHTYTYTHLASSVQARKKDLNYRAFSAKEPCTKGLFCEKSPVVQGSFADGEL